MWNTARLQVASLLILFGFKARSCTDMLLHRPKPILCWMPSHSASSISRQVRGSSYRASTSWWRTPRSSSPPLNSHCPGYRQHRAGAGAECAIARGGQSSGRPPYVLDSGCLWSCGTGGHQARLLRAADTSARADPTLSQGLRAALRALVAILANLRAKEIPSISPPHRPQCSTRTPSSWTASAASRRAT